MKQFPIIKKLFNLAWIVISLFLGSFGNIYSSFEIEQKEQKSSSQESEQVLSADQLNGEVEVSFKITEEGRAKIVSIQSENPDLIKYVQTKMNKVQLEKRDFNLEEIITYRFKFGKEV